MFGLLLKLLEAVMELNLVGEFYCAFIGDFEVEVTLIYGYHEV
jgi:hypothetical protein